MVIDIKKAPVGTQNQTQYMINRANNLKKNLSEEGKNLLAEYSQRIFKEIKPREYDEIVFLTLFEVCTMKMRLDNHDTHKLIITDTLEQFEVFKGVVCQAH